MTLIVNLFGAPGAGKSTTRAGVFNKLKLAGVNCEECTEYAKDLTWEKRWTALASQPYVFGKQLRNMERLIGQVDVLITDSPILLSVYYGRTYSNYPDSFYTFVIDQFKRMGGVNYYLNRVKAYNPKGRNQTAEESDQIGDKLEQLLDDTGVEYIVLDGNEEAKDIIAREVMIRLGMKVAPPFQEDSFKGTSVEFVKFTLSTSYPGYLVRVIPAGGAASFELNPKRANIWVGLSGLVDKVTFG